MIILSDDIIFRKAVIHLLNVELGKFAPAQDLFMMQPDVIELVRKQVCYLLNSDELKAADWNTKEPVFQKLEQMNEKDDKSFIQTSAYLADRLFDIMCDSVEIPSADLLCLSFQTNQEIYYALIKLNYQNSFMHELMKYDNEEIIGNIRHKKILPLGKRISEGIIFNLSLQKVMLKEKKYDKAGEEINYEIKEEVFDGLTGDAKTGYMDSYETNETTDADGTTTKNIIITNTHTPETTQKKVKKIWNDNGNKDGIRPKSVSVNLLADGKVEESFTLSSENNWQAKSKLLPVKVNGKKVNYTWEEVKEDLITGESEIGYKPTYDTDANDADLTLITNTHDRTQPKGKVTITKALDPGNLNMDVGDPSFTFTLSGTDVYGKKHSYEKQIKFTKAEVEKQMKDHPGDPIELSVTFDDLEYGTYTCDEGGMLKYFKLKSLTSDSSNTTVDQKKGTVTFDIGPAGTTAKAQLKGTAKFTNQMIQGSIKLIKKDSNGRVLKDVEFVIQSSDGAEVAKAKTDAAGEITFDGLIPDTYTITETKTKEGKTLLREPITATIPLTMSQVEVDKQNVDTSKAIKQGSNYYFYHLTYEVSNDARLDLPKTGGWIDYLPLAGGMILILSGLFVYYRKKRRKM